MAAHFLAGRENILLLEHLNYICYLSQVGQWRQGQGRRASVQWSHRRLHEDPQVWRHPGSVQRLYHLCRRYLCLPWSLLRPLRQSEADSSGRRCQRLRFLPVGLGCHCCIWTLLLSYRYIFFNICPWWKVVIWTEVSASARSVLEWPRRHRKISTGLTSKNVLSFVQSQRVLMMPLWSQVWSYTETWFVHTFRVVFFGATL